MLNELRYALEHGTNGAACTDPQILGVGGLQPKTEIEYASMIVLIKRAHPHHPFVTWDAVYDHDNDRTYFTHGHYLDDDLEAAFKDFENRIAQRGRPYIPADPPPGRKDINPLFVVE